MSGGRPPLRLQLGEENVQIPGVDEVTLLFESVPHCPPANAHVRRVLARDPGKLADGPAALGHVVLERNGQRHAPEVCSLLDRLVVVVDPVAKLRITLRRRVIATKDEVEARAERVRDVAAERERAEVALVERQLRGRLGEDIAAGAGQCVATMDREAPGWRTEEEAIATALGGRHASSDHERNSANEGGAAGEILESHCELDGMSPVAQLVTPV